MGIGVDNSMKESCIACSRGRLYEWVCVYKKKDSEGIFGRRKQKFEKNNLIFFACYKKHSTFALAFEKELR